MDQDQSHPQDLPSDPSELSAAELDEVAGGRSGNGVKGIDVIVKCHCGKSTCSLCNHGGSK